MMIRSCLIAALSMLASGTFALAQSKPSPPIPVSMTAFMQKHCLKCHGDNNPKAGLSLVTYKDELSLLKARKKWEQLSEMVREGEMPPEGETQPSLADKEAFVKTIKEVFENIDKNAKPDPGRITVRRLNKVEYNNTVRDLFFVDLKPAEDFPSDDVGHGFDNIGDVLTLSPVLMERYLAAAEQVAQRAVLTKIPDVPKRYLAGQYLQPNNAKTPQRRFRAMSPTDADPTISGPFTAAADYLKLSADDDIIVRANLYAQPFGKSPIKVALFITGPKLPDASPDEEVDKLMGAGLSKLKPLKILETYEITATSANKLQTLEYLIKQRGDVQRVGIAVIKPPEGEEPPQLMVENIWSEGPLETRPLSHRTIVACSPDKSQPEQTREVMQRFVSRAFRRPATPAEVERYSKIVDATVAEGQKWEAGVQLAVQAVLVSPKFLFRFELDDRPTSAESHPIDEFQLASRLSYFLWSTMPDKELTELASKNQLTANLPAQVQRMLKDPKANSLVENFAMQWLQLGRLQLIAPDQKLFPSFNEPLRQAMFQETKLFLNEIIREDRGLLDLIAADFTYLNEPLARHYGIADTNGTVQGQKAKKPGGQPIRGPQFVRVSLDGADRGGLLLQASVLTVTSNPTRTSPVKRGRWVLEQLLGTPPPPPPPNVPELDKNDGKPLTGSLRQRMEQHRVNPACANCHASMDPLGFAFENFNAIGGYRQKDGEFDIDPSGVLPGGKAFQGPAELKAILLEKRELFARCVAEKMLTYALGRGLEYYDKRTIDKVCAGVSKENFKFSTLVTEIVQSDPFRLRRGAE